ncbi:hypothetical protein TVAG_483770 [Trichomonas vaginalis G3]|uniref:Uncharacterized protein n=1 Tax=Trichomonas vaginalis (strain ATCC PRA-98 / G3) TaxID=412133 RepID=A2EA21_TRIV3|nr:endonuclease Chain A domain-containing protein [Trichomonas vaginalis G3]EAY10467.1 hypothetical protein TVAG_483770 [Trichomonas vaginalis G3]KAI5489305.1 endonuclease Chain A domain-containing protein [Trichomonas vaginalis G3]|eukprot:XP_001322690.1 hypothetical protein [Trichomonas vaginalis G3]
MGGLDYNSSIVEAIKSAKEEISIMSRGIDTTNSSNELVKALVEASHKNITIRVLSRDKTNTTTEFFQSKNVKFLSIDGSGVYDHIVSDFIIIDHSTLLLLSTFLVKPRNFNGKKIGLKTSHPKVVDDAYGIFDLAWSRLVSEINETLPPISRFWPNKYRALTSNTRKAELTNAHVYLAIPESLALAPGRMKTKDAANNTIIKFNHDIYISCSFFDLPNNFFIQNALIRAAYDNKKIRILLSNNTALDDSKRSAGLVAGIPNIEVRVGKENYPNFLISTTNLYFLSDSITGRVYKNNVLGIAILANFTDNSQKDSITNSLIKEFMYVWDHNSTNFSQYAKEIYDSDF